MKINIIFKTAITILLISFLNSCKKDSSNVPAANTGSFVNNTTTYTGNCTSIPDVGSGGASGNIDVEILTTSGTFFFIYNMPQASSGTFSITDGYNNVGGSTLYAIFGLSSGNLYASQSGGTVTKTGATSFTFSSVEYDLNSNLTYTVTGKGSY